MQPTWFSEGDRSMEQLTSGERELGAVILIVLAIIGIVMAAVGQFDPLGIHG